MTFSIHKMSLWQRKWLMELACFCAIFSYAFSTAGHAPTFHVPYWQFVFFIIYPMTYCMENICRCLPGFKSPHKDSHLVFWFKCMLSFIRKFVFITWQWRPNAVGNRVAIRPRQDMNSLRRRSVYRLARLFIQKPPPSQNLTMNKRHGSQSECK